MSTFQLDTTGGISTTGTNSTSGILVKTNKNTDVSHVWIYAAQATNNATVKIWDSTTVAVASSTVGLSLSLGWNKIALGSVITLVANVEYRLSVYHNHGANRDFNTDGTMTSSTIYYTRVVAGVTFSVYSQWYFSSGDAFPSSIANNVKPMSFGLEFITNTAPNPPSGLSVSDTGSGIPRLGWTFNDPDVGNTQSALQALIERWTGSVWVTHLDTGKIISVNSYYDILAANKLTGNTQYRFSVKTWDNFDVVSTYSTTYAWTTAKPFQATGTYTSDVVNLARSGATTSGVLTWTATVPTGTTLGAEYRTSANGSTWGAWTSIISGSSIPAANYAQVRFNFTSDGNLLSPGLTDWALTCPQEYYASGEWLSPVVDTNAVGGEAYQGLWSFSTVSSGASAATQYRVSPDGVNWGIWLNTAPTVTTWDRYVQLRLTLNSTASRLQSYLVASASMTWNTALNNSGTWISPLIDVRGIDPATSVVTWTVALNGGTLAVEARASYGTSVELGSWQAVAVSGNSLPMALTDMNYAQLRVTENRASTTVSPSVSSVAVTLTAANRRGIWTSQTVDVSQALNKTTGKVTSDMSLGGGTVKTRYQYSTTAGASWSAWADALADGSMTTPANTTHVKARHVLIGSSTEIKSSTLFFDGTPSTTALISGLSANADYDFTQLRDMVIICNGKDVPRKWDKTNPPTVIGGSPPAFQMIETHLNRAWGAGDPENPSRVRYSDILNPESWPALNFIDFNPEDGDRITTIFRYGQQLVVSKRNTVALLTGDRSTNFAVAWLDHDAGAEGFRGMQIVDKYLAYIARDGIRFSDLTKSVRATERLVPSWNGLNHRRLNQAAIVTLGNYMLAALPSDSSLVNDQVWFFDTLRTAWSIIPNWKISSWLKFRQYGEEILLGGDSEKGQVYEVFTGTTDADGTNMEYDFQTKDFDAGTPERYKVIRDCILIVAGVAGESVLDVRFVVDGVEHPVPTTDTTVPAGAGIVHSIRLIPPVYGAVLGQRVSLRIRGLAHVHAVALGLVVRGVVPGVS